jgi:hypothetical protein
MKRRDFILETLGVTAGLVVSGTGQAAKPCPPDIIGASNPDHCGAFSGSALAEAASRLSPGEWVAFKAPPAVGPFGISWQNRTGFWDSSRHEFHFMAKAQSGGAASHWIYSEATDSWRSTGSDVSPGQAGHIWVVTFDHTDDPGDYYYLDFDASDFIRYMDRSVEAGIGNSSHPWRKTSSASFSVQNGSSRPSTSIGYHPNLFGSEDPGILVFGVTTLSAWRKSTNSWLSLATYGSSSSQYFNRRSAPSVYIPGYDRLIMGTGVANTQECLLLDAGSGGEVATGSLEFEGAPTRIVGTASQSNDSQLSIDPRDDSTVILLESSGDRVWTNATGGTEDGWRLEPFAHPFWQNLPVNPNDYGSWTCGAIPEYGIMWGLASYADGGGSILWRPGST